MKETADGARESEVTQLRNEIAQLHHAMSETHEELLSHRQALEQCLDTRKGVMELLANREAFAQCLELREGIQAVLGSTKLFGEFAKWCREKDTWQDRIAELDLSLAGVSDNTARHGKAISTLTEQQKRTSSTVDAVVRAVKRLAHSRSRSRESSARPSTVPTPGGGGTEAHGVAHTLSTNGPVVSDDMLEATQMPRGVRAPGQSPDVAGVECEDGDGLHVNRMEWWGGHQGVEEPQPRFAGDADLLLDDEQMEFGGTGDSAWDWPGWPLPREDDARPYPGLRGVGAQGLGESFHPSEVDEPRYFSGSSSCGSDGRSWRRRSGRSGGTSAKGYSSGPDAGIPDPMCLSGSGDGGAALSQASRRNGSGNPAGMSAEVKGCVNGVLAKIEEALTNLDSNSREAPGGSSRATSGRSSRPGAPEATGAIASAGQRTPRSSGTPQNPVTPRGATPRVRPATAPYQPWHGPDAAWQQTNSWA